MKSRRRIASAKPEPRPLKQETATSEMGGNGSVCSAEILRREAPQWVSFDYSRRLAATPSIVGYTRDSGGTAHGRLFVSPVPQAGVTPSPNEASEPID
jgi:hypothetical protein